jgi:hypothetical protein
LILVYSEGKQTFDNWELGIEKHFFAMDGMKYTAFYKVA